MSHFGECWILFQNIQKSIKQFHANTEGYFDVHIQTNLANLWLHYAINLEYVNKIRPNCGSYNAMSILYVNKT
jgi:hypothetical protein